MLPRVLYLDDDLNQLKHIKANFINYFNITVFSSAVEAILYLKSNKVDAIISDLHMPIINGLKFYELIKENNLIKIPFFFLSSDISNDSKITGLKKGAYDYLNIDMSFEEMFIRITNRINESKISFKNISIDCKQLMAFDGQNFLDLTQIEYKILFLLIKAQGELITREELKNFAWPNVIVTDKTINSHLTNLRIKIEKDDLKIISIKGKGISFAQIGPTQCKEN